MLMRQRNIWYPIHCGQVNTAKQQQLPTIYWWHRSQSVVGMFQLAIKPSQLNDTQHLILLESHITIITFGQLTDSAILLDRSFRCCSLNGTKTHLFF